MNPIISINQPIDVLAAFNYHSQPNRIKPLRMRWNGRDIDLPNLGLCYPTRRGQQLLYIFNVSDGANDYSLELDTTTMQWTLISMIDGASL